jgi:hypothetical protein
MSKKGLSTINIILLVVAAFVVGALIYYFHEGSDVSAYLPVNGSSSTVATSGEPISPGTVFQAPPATTTPSPTVITATLTPKTGGVGTAVTIHGSGFASTGNMVTYRLRMEIRSNLLFPVISVQIVIRTKRALNILS